MLTNLRPAGPRAVLFPVDGCEPHILEAGAEPLLVGDAGTFIHEPDNAVIRAGLVAEAAGEAWLLASGVAYLTSDAPLSSPFVTDYRIREVLDLDVAGLRRWVKAARIGTLEIKCRAIDIDPATLRRQLRPRGPGMATLILARTIRGAKAFIVERLPR